MGASFSRLRDHTMIDFDVFFFAEFCAEFLTRTPIDLTEMGFYWLVNVSLTDKNATKKFRRNKEESLIYAYTKSFFWPFLSAL